MNEKRIDVNASITSKSGASDGAYDLIARGATVEAFLASLREVLNSDWGLTNDDGPFYLTLHVTSEGNGENVPM